MKISPKSKVLDRTAIIEDALGGRELNATQQEGVEQIISGYSALIAGTLSRVPSEADIQVLTDGIRNSIHSTLLIMETYVEPTNSNGYN